MNVRKKQKKSWKDGGRRDVRGELKSKVRKEKGEKRREKDEKER